MLVALTGAAMTLTQYQEQYFDKQRIHTSLFTGQMWLDELLTGMWHGN